jgi:death on curing protein
MSKPITLELIKYSAHRLAQDTMSWNEPIPEFHTRFPHVLESCIAAPFQKFDKKSLYGGLTGKAAVLFYLLIKNHPLAPSRHEQNGNKRIAVTSLLIFLFINKKWLKVDKTILYNTAVWVAQSPPEAKGEVIEYIEKFVKKHLVEFSEK